MIRFLQIGVSYAFETRQRPIRLQRPGLHPGLQPPGPRRSIKPVQPAVNMNMDAGLPPPVPIQTPAMERDADLVAALRRGDRHAVLEGLMDRYRQKVLHLAVSIVRDPALAEDMAQTIFVKVWQALPKFDGRAAHLDLAVHDCAQYLPDRGGARAAHGAARGFAEVADDDGDPMVFGTAQAGAKPRGRRRRNTTSPSCSSSCPSPIAASSSCSIWKIAVVRKSASFCPCPRVQSRRCCTGAERRLAALAGEPETES